GLRDLVQPLADDEPLDGRVLRLALLRAEVRGVRGGEAEVRHLREGAELAEAREERGWHFLRRDEDGPEAWLAGRLRGRRDVHLDEVVQAHRRTSLGTTILTNRMRADAYARKVKAFFAR